MVSVGVTNKSKDCVRWNGQTDSEYWTGPVFKLLISAYISGKRRKQHYCIAATTLEAVTTAPY